MCARGWLRQYWRGASTMPSSSAAASHGQRGFHSMPRASATMSALPDARISSACFGSVIMPTAITGIFTACLTASANGTW